MSTNYLAQFSANLSTISAVNINYSTLTGSTIIASSIISNSTINVSSITSRAINYSTLSGSTLIAQMVNYSTLAGSTLNSNTMIINSTLTGSTLTTQNVNYSTLTGSTLNSNTMTINSTLTGSTLTTQNVNYSTLTGSTMAANTMTINSSINVSTITARAINYSTLTGSTMTINTLVIASTLTVSTLIATNNPAGVITSSMISLGASTNQSYTTLAQGNYSTSTNWLSTLTNLVSTKTVTMSGNAQTQLAISQVSTISSIFYTSTLGTSWSTISNVTGLPTATQTNYTCGAVSGNGQYAALGVNGGYLYVTSTLTSLTGPSFANTNPNIPAIYTYLPFEGNTNDASGNNRNATVTGSVTYVTGIVGKNAVNIVNTTNGTAASNYIRGALSGVTNFSVSGWFNLQSYSNTEQIIFSCGGTGYDVYIKTIANGNVLAANHQPINTQLGATSYAIALYTWYNFTYIFQAGGTSYFYVNNVLIASATSPSTGLTTINGFGLGCHDSATSFAFNGYIDDLKIYNTAITFTPMVPANWSNVAISNSGQYMLATVENGGLYMSSNFGSTWSQVTSVALNSYWQGLSISASGQYMISSQSINPVIYHPFNGSIVDVMGGSSSQYIVADGYYQNGSNSPGSYPGTVTYATGKIGSNAVNVTSGAVIANYTFPITGFTVSFWLYPISGYTAQFYLSSRTVTNTGVIAGGVIYCGIDPTTNVYKTYSTGAYFESYTATATATSPMNTWCHITITYTPGTFTHYLNGNVVCTAKFTLTSPMLSYFLGQTLEYYVAICYFDDFRIYSTPLTAYQIGQIYENTTTQSAINNINLPVLSSNYGSSWSTSSYAFASTSVALSGSGQYALGNSNASLATTTPQLTGLTTSTWNVSGVVWTASASSNIAGSNFLAQYAFNNYYGTVQPYSWCCADGLYTIATGAYSKATPTPTIILASGSYAGGTYTGEYLQLQSGVPLVMYSYGFACAVVQTNAPKNYFIVGSNDGTNWYPIQNVIGVTNPFTGQSQIYNTHVLANYTGTQTIVGGQTGQLTTTSYPTSGNAYTYFRIIANAIWPGVTGGNFELNEWFINFNNAFTRPQLTGLTGDTTTATPVATTWTSNNVTWTATGSSVTGAGFQPWVAFNNISTGNIGSYSWASSPLYTVTTGVYTGSVSTTISAPYSAPYLGEWLQIQSSVPVVLYNYTFAAGNFGNFSKAYLIAGSNDGTTWYPIQLASMASNPFGSTNYRPATSYLLANYTGTQTLTSEAVPAGATVTTTSYSTSSNAYTYFRIISNQSFGVQWFELEEWFVNFTISPYVVSNYLAGLSTGTYSAPVFSPALTNAPIASAVSQTGQYMVLITNSITVANVYYSTNYGANFTGLLLGTTPMTSCAISSDGSCITVSNATTVYQLNNNSIGFSVSVGNQAGQQNQGQNAIAIGSYAGQQNQTANSIVLNATGTALNSYVPGFYVSPIQQYGGSTSSSFSLLGYGSDNQIVQTTGVVISPSTSSSNSNNSLTVLGNVGIGTTNPQYQLDISGTSRSSVQMFSDNSAAVTATPALDYNTFGQNWTNVNTAVTGKYIGCSMSANGQYQITCFQTSGGIYYSSNYGQTWALATLVSGGALTSISWNACAMSASGQYCIGTVAAASGLIYVSSNYGQTWTSTGQATVNNNYCAISGSGQYMISCGGFYNGIQSIYLSSNYGVTWTSVGPTLQWISCTMSITGQYMYACTYATDMYISSNYGQTWTQVIVTSGAYFITCSATGQYICTTDSANFIYYSSNYGASWARATSPALQFGGMAMSASGQYVIAGGGGDNTKSLYYSTNYGQNWTIVPSSPTGNWYGFAMSANGQYLLAGSITASSNLRQSITRSPSMSVSGPINVTGNINLTGSVQYNGVSITTGTGSIWTPAAGGVAYYTGGNVGIGTATPLTGLHLVGTLTVLGTGTNVIANPNTGGSNGTLNIVRTGASTNYGTTITFGLASGATTASFDNYGLIMGGSNGALASYTGFVCLDVCNSQNSFYGLTTPGNSSIYADTNLIRFNILSSNKMTILANGNVGIGIASPLSDLYVYKNTPTGWAGMGYFGNATTGFICGTFNNGAVIGGHNAALNAWTSISIGAATTTTSIFGSIINLSGNVGIGTTVANAPLQFSNTLANRKIVLYDDINNDHQFYGFGINAGILRYQVASASTDHVFYAGTSSSASIELMHIKGNGNVGIGTGSPGSYKLYVMGDSTNNGILVNSSSTYQTPGITLLNTNHSITWGISSSGTVSTWAEAGALGFYSSGYGGANSGFPLVIRSNGNVGFGTNNPELPISIYGASPGIKFTSTVYPSNSFYFFIGTSNGALFLAPNISSGTPGANFAIGASSWAVTSDVRLKRNVTSITSALNKILELRPITFQYKSDNQDEEFREGFIAQEVQNIFPSKWIVTNSGSPNIEYDENGNQYTALSVCETHLIPHIVKAIQEQQTTIQQQAIEITALQSTVAAQSTQLSTQESQIAQLMSRLAAAGIA